MLEFPVFGDRNDSTNLQKLLTEIKYKIFQNNDGGLRTGTEAANTDAQYLSKKALHSLLSECTASANFVKISITNENYAHKASLKQNLARTNCKKDMANLLGMLLRERAS